MATSSDGAGVVVLFVTGFSSNWMLSSSLWYACYEVYSIRVYMDIQLNKVFRKRHVLPKGSEGIVQGWYSLRHWGIVENDIPLRFYSTAFSMWSGDPHKIPFGILGISKEDCCFASGLEFG